MTLTPAELDELAALEAKATPGEWSAIHVDDDSPDGGPGHTTMMPMAALTTDADCSFVAALRNHAGPLLSMARRLGELQYRWGEFSASNLANLHSLNTQLTAATARVAELDAALTTALADAEMAEHAHDACEELLTAATARAEAAERDYAACAHAIGIEHAPDTGPTAPGPVEAVVWHIEEAFRQALERQEAIDRAEAADARAQAAENRCGDAHDAMVKFRAWVVDVGFSGPLTDAELASLDEMIAALAAAKLGGG